MCEYVASNWFSTLFWTSLNNNIPVNAFVMWIHTIHITLNCFCMSRYRANENEFLVLTLAVFMQACLHVHIDDEVGCVLFCMHYT